MEGPGRVPSDSERAKLEQLDDSKKKRASASVARGPVGRFASKVSVKDALADMSSLMAQISKIAYDILR